jgi:phosphoglycolate phosphatase
MTGILHGATIVFDLDGTLVDTAPDLAASLNAVLADQGLAPVTLAGARSMIGGGVRMLLARGFAAAGEIQTEPRFSELLEQFICIYRSRIADASRPYPGASKALDTLGAEGARLAICTNKRSDLAIALLDRLGLAGRFAAIVGGDDGLAAKPDPQLLRLSIERAGGRLDQAVMVGDSEADAQAARAAAIPLVLVDFGYAHTPVADLKPDALISHFDALPAACIRLIGRARTCPAAVAGI